MSERRYRFGPLEERAVVGPLRAGQVAVLAVGALAGLGSLYGVRSVAGMVLALLALGAAAAAYLRSRAGANGGGVGAGGASLGAAPPARRGRVSLPHARRRGADRPERRLSDESSLPPELAGVELLSVPYGGAEVGVIRERGAGTYTAAMAVRPGAFALRDRAEQERSLDSWGAVLGELRARRQPGSAPAVDRADHAGPGR